MKVMMLKEFNWVAAYRVSNFEVRQYEAHHKNGVDTEDGLVFITYEGQRIINVKVPLVVEYSPTDRFIVEPSAKGLRSFLGCDGFMQFMYWLSETYELQARTMFHQVFLNSKMPVSGLSAYIKDKLMEEQQ